MPYGAYWPANNYAASGESEVERLRRENRELREKVEGLEKEVERVLRQGIAGIGYHDVEAYYRDDGEEGK